MYARDNITAAEVAAVMLRLLAGGEYDVTALTEAVGAHRPAVSQPLGRLRLAGLVATRRQGRRVFYTASGGHVRRLVAEALSAAEHLPGPTAVATSADGPAAGAGRPGR
jgi:DNA-binding transcriptional ArsR family regulator